jgi:hypothetical protein
VAPGGREGDGVIVASSALSDAASHSPLLGVRLRVLGLGLSACFTSRLDMHYILDERVLPSASDTSTALSNRIGLKRFHRPDGRPLAFGVCLSCFPVVRAYQASFLHTYTQRRLVDLPNALHLIMKMTFDFLAPNQPHKPPHWQLPPV